ncbi:MAG: glycine hydroxymethyltransferase [Spirochaetaceae bacterium]|jgi:glycine hydroxymethyltransferase|nr:glycine hydroxymethyltransferase [Spirochaetaceae bacterium]
MNVLMDYLKKNENPDPAMVAYLASLTKVAEVAPEIAASTVKELEDQRSYLKLIASENYCSLSTQLAMGNLLTDKYAEGFPFHRFYAGCDNVDSIEDYAAKKACEIFGCEHAYVQPHSGADANMIAYWAILNTRVQVPALKEMGETNPSKLSREDWNKIRAKLGNQRMLGLDYYSGGHLTHGYRHNVSAQMFDAYTYTVSKETGLLDYDEIEKQAVEIKPLILLAGYSAYPREINFRRMREIADKVGAVLMVDMAHFAGLVAGGVFIGDFNPIKFAQVVTTTTHKTLRGPRGGMVLSTAEFAEAVDKGCPLVIGGPLPHVMAAKAVAFTEAAKPEFATYSKIIVKNCQALASKCIEKGLTIATGGTDNHLFLIDVRNLGLNGRQGESVLRECGFTLNRNSLPFDPNGPWYTSGLRLGTAALTTLGMGVEEMAEIADILALVLKNTKPATIASGANAGKPSKAKFDIDDKIVQEARKRIKTLLDGYLLYPELDLEVLKEAFPG